MTFKPKYVVGPTGIRDKDVFEDELVSSSLPYRRVSYDKILPILSGVFMDEERILFWKVSSPLSAYEVFLIRAFQRRQDSDDFNLTSMSIADS